MHASFSVAISLYNKGLQTTEGLIWDKFSSGTSVTNKVVLVEHYSNQKGTLHNTVYGNGIFLNRALHTPWLKVASLPNTPYTNVALLVPAQSPLPWHDIRHFSIRTWHCPSYFLPDSISTWVSFSSPTLRILGCFSCPKENKPLPGVPSSFKKYFYSL